MTATTGVADDATPIGHREGTELGRAAYDRFVSVLEQLEPGDWAKPTDCAGWTVRDLAGHMLGAMRSAASMREMASQLREIKAKAKATGADETDVMTRVQIGRTATRSPDEVVAECRALVDPAAAGRRRTPWPMRRLVRFPVTFGAVTESWTLGYLVDVILTRDAWLHTVDLCRAVGREPVLTPDVDGRIVADVAAEWARRHGQPYELTLTGPAGGRFSAGAAGEAIEIDAVEFCRVLSGRAPGGGLLAQDVPF